jgi:hypothetical protein
MRPRDDGSETYVNARRCAMTPERPAPASPMPKKISNGSGPYRAKFGNARIERDVIAPRLVLPLVNVIATAPSLPLTLGVLNVQEMH